MDPIKVKRGRSLKWQEYSSTFCIVITSLVETDPFLGYELQLFGLTAIQWLHCRSLQIYIIVLVIPLIMLSIKLSIIDNEPTNERSK